MSKWTSWSFKIADRAFKNVRPLNMELIKEQKHIVHRYWLFFTEKELVYTGNFIIRLKYDRGPGTRVQVAKVAFDDLKNAQRWFDAVVNTVFCVKDNDDTSVKNTKKTSNIKRLKPKLRIIKDDE